MARFGTVEFTAFNPNRRVRDNGCVSSIRRAVFLPQALRGAGQHFASSELLDPSLAPTGRLPKFSQPDVSKLNDRLVVMILKSEIAASRSKRGLAENLFAVQPNVYP